MEKTKIICWTIIISIFLIGIILIILANNTYNVHFSMDDNMLEAIKEINWSMIGGNNTKP